MASWKLLPFPDLLESTHLAKSESDVEWEELVLGSLLSKVWGATDGLQWLGEWKDTPLLPLCVCWLLWITLLWARATYAPVSLWHPVSNCFGYLLSNGFAGSSDNSIFNFLRNCYAVLQSGDTILHSPQQCPRSPVSPLPCQHLLFSRFLIAAILMGVRW